jgi:hypothetical protein
MKLSLRSGILLSVLVFTPVVSMRCYAVEEQPATLELAGVELPDAPVPQLSEQSKEDGPAVATNQVEAQKSDQQRADEQIKAQEKQRVFGILPTFNTTYLGADTVSMSAKQKFGLAFRSATDPMAFGMAAIIAGFDELGGENNGFPWGPKGYFERTGAAYLDSFDGAMIGNAILPSILHQDPRYYRMGHGSKTRRLFYALGTTFLCKHDKTGKWEPNYSNFGGNIAAGAISNLYYPSDDGGVGLTITNGMIVSAEGAFASVLNEFWPDISRKLLHKDPTNGLDDRMKAADEAKRGANHNAR